MASQSTVNPPAFSTEHYFESEAPPPTMAAELTKVKDFVDRMVKEQRRVVLVTSGGTTVPLETNTVRFLDNFSAGTRGATSAEYFLKTPFPSTSTTSYSEPELTYGVIFFHRQHSLLPFTRHYSHSIHPFLSLLESTPSDNALAIKESFMSEMLPIFQSYKETEKQGTLLSIPFVTVNDYLWMLKGIAEVMRPLGRNSIFYLAAAVSDFFLPTSKMSEHKIQSGKGALTLEMDQCPKILRPLVDEWTKKQAFVVSFKLETDPTILISKARGALDRYGHQIVIGNDLAQRKKEVVFVEPAGASSYKETWIKLRDAYPGVKDDKALWTDDGVTEIEDKIIKELVLRHAKWVENGIEGK